MGSRTVLYDAIMVATWPHAFIKTIELYRVKLNMNYGFYLITMDQYWSISCDRNTRPAQNTNKSWERGYTGIVCSLCSIFYKPKAAFKKQFINLKNTFTEVKQHLITHQNILTRICRGESVALLFPAFKETHIPWVVAPSPIPKSHPHIDSDPSASHLIIWGQPG